MKHGQNPEFLVDNSSSLNHLAKTEKVMGERHYYSFLMFKLLQEL